MHTKKTNKQMIQMDTKWKNETKRLRKQNHKLSLKRYNIYSRHFNMEDPTPGTGSVPRATKSTNLHLYLINLTT